MRCFHGVAFVLALPAVAGQVFFKPNPIPDNYIEWTATLYMDSEGTSSYSASTDESVVFWWEAGTQDVWAMHDETAWKNCDFSYAVRLVEPVTSGGNYIEGEVDLGSLPAGTHYLACGVGTHCDAGQKLILTTWKDDYANEAYWRSLHAGVTTCHDCHLVPFSHYPFMAWDAATKTFDGPEDFQAAHVPTVLCSGCHTQEGKDHAHEFTGPMTPELLAAIVTVDQSPMHKVHMEATTRDPGTFRGGGEHEQAPDEDRHHSPEELQEDDKHEEGAILCMDCHGSSNNRAHRFQPSRDNCLQCHGGMAHAGGRLDTLVCQECHFDRFLGSKPEASGGH